MDKIYMINYIQLTNNNKFSQLLCNCYEKAYSPRWPLDLGVNYQIHTIK